MLDLQTTCKWKEDLRGRKVEYDMVNVEVIRRRIFGNAETSPIKTDKSEEDQID